MANRRRILMDAVEAINERVFYIYDTRDRLPSHLKRLRSRLIHRLLH